MAVPHSARATTRLFRLGALKVAPAIEEVGEQRETRLLTAIDRPQGQSWKHKSVGAGQRGIVELFTEPIVENLLRTAITQQQVAGSNVKPPVK